MDRPRGNGAGGPFLLSQADGLAGFQDSLARSYQRFDVLRAAVAHLIGQILGQLALRDIRPLFAFILGQLGERGPQGILGVPERLKDRRGDHGIYGHTVTYVGYHSTNASKLVHAISQTNSCTVLESSVLQATFLFGKLVIESRGIDAAPFNKHSAEDSTMP